MFKLPRLLFNNGKNVFNRTYPISVTRHISAPSTQNLFFEQKENPEGKEESSWSRLFRFGLLFGLGYFGYTQRKRLIPSVEASTSKRHQYNFIADVVEKTASAVVNIELEGRRQDFVQERFNGSGFIIKEDGLILTNAHVVMGKGPKVIVKLYDGTTYQGVIEDVDMKGDLATVRIETPNKLPVLPLGTSSDLRPGEFVVAMGSPLSLSNTATSGIISRAQRKSSELKIMGKEMDYIQTDAAITFGNSGGPLVNLDGEVIGINSMKVTAGISFAIPVDYAKEFLKLSEARKKGILPKGVETSPRRYMGITMLSLTPHIIAEIRMRHKGGVFIPAEISSGVLVCKVVFGSPSHFAGLMQGDIIVELNGEKVEGVATIYKALESSSELMLKVLRMGSFLMCRVVPEAS